MVWVGSAVCLKQNQPKPKIILLTKMWSYVKCQRKLKQSLKMESTAARQVSKLY